MTTSISRTKRTSAKRSTDRKPSISLEQTSKQVAKVASKQRRDPNSSKELKGVAASALTQPISRG